MTAESRPGQVGAAQAVGDADNVSLRVVNSERTNAAAEGLAPNAADPSLPGADGDAVDVDAPRLSRLQRLLAMADEDFDVFPAPDGRLYGMRRGEPHRAFPLVADGGLMDELVTMFHARSLTWPLRGERTEVLEYLRMSARRSSPRRLFTRSAWLPDDPALYLDVGDLEETVIEVTPEGWRPASDVPVVFRRPPALAALQISDRHTSIEDGLGLLWSLVPVAPSDRPVVLALLLTAWLSGVPQPVVLVTGPRDSGKTTSARFLLSLIDPVHHERGGSLPGDEASWKARVNTARVLLVDNVGHLTAEKSDLLCRVATGGEATSRQLYTDDAAHVTELRLPVWLTSIDPGILRDDLATRLVVIELLPLTPVERKADSELSREQDAARPVITRALLDLLVDVLAVLPTESALALMHRMGDFEMVLRSIDTCLGTDGSVRLGELGTEIAGAVLETDPVAQALLKRARHVSSEPWLRADDGLVGDWSPTQLLAALSDFTGETVSRAPGWPKTPGVLTMALNRLATPLQQVHGIRVETGIREGKNRVRRIRISVRQADEPA